MKIRNGFVSNSSSMSSIILASAHKFKKVDPDKLWESWINVEVPFDSYYGRSRVELQNTLEKKIEWLITMAAAKYGYKVYDPGEYFEEMYILVNRIKKLGESLGYHIYIDVPALKGSHEIESYDPKTKEGKREEKWSYHNECGTESYLDWTFLIETDDALKRFLFNPDSFVITGGDEYDETYKLEFEAKQRMNYRYEIHSEHDDRFGLCIPDYYDADHIPEYDEDDEGQENLPWNKYEDCEYSHCSRCDNSKCKYQTATWCYKQRIYVFQRPDLEKICNRKCWECPVEQIKEN